MENKHIIIGKHAVVIDAPNKSLKGLSGIVINETKNTFVLKVGDQFKTVLKSGAILSLDGKEVTIQNKRVEERIKSR